MAAASFMDSNLLKYEIALNRLGARKSSKRQRPIVERVKIEPARRSCCGGARRWRRFGIRVRAGKGGGDECVVG